MVHTTNDWLKSNTKQLAVALMRYSFRDGSVEDMHEQGKLSHDDMKTLNTYMLNHLSGALEVLAEDYAALQAMCDYYIEADKIMAEIRPEKEKVIMLRDAFATGLLRRLS